MFDAITATLYSAEISDVLDNLGHRNRWMDHGIRPLTHGITVTGRAATMLITEVHVDCDEPYTLLIEALDSLHSGDMAIINCNPLDAYRSLG